MSESILRFFQFVYQFFQLSFYYWVYLLKGFILYSFIPATAALWETSKGLLWNSEEKQELNLMFKTNYQKYDKHSLASFFIVIIMILLHVALFFVNRSNHVFSLALVIVIIYLIVLIFINIIYMFYYFVADKVVIKNALALAFVTAIRRPIRSIVVLVVLLSMYLLMLWNLVAFLALGPSLFGISMNLLFKHFSIPIKR